MTGLSVFGFKNCALPVKVLLRVFQIRLQESTWFNIPPVFGGEALSVKNIFKNYKGGKT
jgi:hypothetical protein